MSSSTRAAARRLLLGALAVALLAPPAAVVPPAAAAPAPAPAPAAAPAAPNVLLVLADDQATSTFSRELMPAVFERIVDQGARFDRSYVGTPLCCPSRSQFLTGLYQHHAGVDDNAQPTNVSPAPTTMLRRPTLVHALQARGYRTMLAGKYLNGEPCGAQPQFDRSACTHSYSKRDPLVTVDGQEVQESGPTTQVLADHLVDFLADTPATQPFFALYAPTSPHTPGDDPRYTTLPVTPPRPPGWDEDTMTSARPPWLRRPPVDDIQRRVWDTKYTNMARAVRGLDDSVASVLDALGPRLDDTLVVYASDNGYLYGEHRRSGKVSPYEGSVRVPLAVRYPALVPTSAPFRTSALAQNVDVAATVAAVTGTPWGGDGRSLVPALRRTGTPRAGVLLQNCEGVSQPCSSSWMRYVNDAGAVASVPTYRGVVTATHKYVEYGAGGYQELYDLSRDPHELRNLAGTASAAAVAADLQARLRGLLAPPAVQTTVVSGPSGTTTTSDPVFTFFSQSRHATYRCRLVSGGTARPWRPCHESGVRFGPLPDGDHVLEVAGTDERGVADASPARRAFTVRGGDGVARPDRAGPTVWSDPLVPFTTRDASVRVRLRADEPAQLRCSVDGAAAVDCGAGLTAAAAAEGRHRLVVTATDDTGSTTTTTFTWYRLVSRPTATVGPATVRGSTAQLALSGAVPALPGAAMASYRVVLDGGAPFLSGEDLVLRALAPGEHTVTVTAVDSAGGTSVPVTRTFRTT